MACEGAYMKLVAVVLSCAMLLHVENSQIHVD